jgi:hypothetical protein
LASMLEKSVGAAGV